MDLGGFSGELVHFLLSVSSQPSALDSQSSEPQAPQTLDIRLVAISFRFLCLCKTDISTYPYFQCHGQSQAMIYLKL